MSEDLTEWRPINDIDLDDLPAWDGPLYELKDEDGNTMIAEYGWDEESHNGFTCAWHLPDTLDHIDSSFCAVAVRLAPE